MMRIIKKLGIFIILIIAGIGLLVGIMLLLEKLVIPRDYYFYQYNPVSEKAMIYLILIPAVTVFGVLLGKLRRKRDAALEDMYDLYFFWKHLPRGKFVLIVLWIISLYCCFSSVTVVTKDKIICRSPFHPSGITHDYEDITQIYTAFGQKNLAFSEYKKKGNFYYQIELDGKKIVFDVPSVNENIKRYTDDTYLELEEFDQKLVALGIPKQADETGWEDCDLDSQYVNRFRRIIALH